MPHYLTKNLTTEQSAKNKLADLKQKNEEYQQLKKKLPQEIKTLTTKISELEEQLQQNEQTIKDLGQRNEELSTQIDDAKIATDEFNRDLENAKRACAQLPNDIRVLSLFVEEKGWDRASTWEYRTNHARKKEAKRQAFLASTAAPTT